MPHAQHPFELYDIDHLLTTEEIAIRDTVRRYVDDRIRPEIDRWFESGEIPARELAREMGAMGLLGMHLTGYGCAGLGAVDYGLACLELEARRRDIASPETSGVFFLSLLEYIATK